MKHLMRFPDGEPCPGCVARKGTDASRTEQTVKDFRLSVEDNLPFFCHQAMTGYPHGYGRVTRLCRGWCNAVNAKERP